MAEHREKLAELRDLIRHIGDNPQAINDTDFRQKLAQVEKLVNQLLEDARNAVGEYGAYRCNVFIVPI